jgi:hypothetical protein
MSKETNSKVQPETISVETTNNSNEMNKKIIHPTECR